ncbi:MAG: hypothetical protein A2787_09780 [Omnitrophica WOR_2 bacterium RIFCSPHIGHO2_01_FULL_48_9]|nr:MAG: hypothetical protein A2787_09780 [Omnitrophica WOR_2 bacterium RIFCSPHIGHO2_01_FULL_48_9]
MKIRLDRWLLITFILCCVVFYTSYVALGQEEATVAANVDAASISPANVSPAEINLSPAEVAAAEVAALESGAAPSNENVKRAEPIPLESIVPLPAGAAETNSRYTLGEDDVIEISVMRHPEVSGQYIINNEGNIQYEFIGDVKIEGFTKDEVKDFVVQKLSEYIISPEVTVKIVGYNSKIVYVVGEVGAPGKIFMRGDTITVREALMEARLPLLTAASKRSLVITPSELGNAEQRNVDVEALLYQGDLRENLVMKPGDTLYVPPTFLAKTMRAISPVTQPVSAAAGTGRTVIAPF